MSNKYNGTIVNFSLVTTWNFYAGASVNDDEKQIYIATNSWNPLFWEQNPAWDSRDSNFATFGMRNPNSKQ